MPRFKTSKRKVILWLGVTIQFAGAIVFAFLTKIAQTDMLMWASGTLSVTFLALAMTNLSSAKQLDKIEEVLTVVRGIERSQEARSSKARVMETTLDLVDYLIKRKTGSNK